MYDIHVYETVSRCATTTFPSKKVVLFMKIHHRMINLPLQKSVTPIFCNRNFCY